MLEVVNGHHRFVTSADFSGLHRGFAPGGPQDRFSCQLANQMLGNEIGAGTIELTVLSRCEILVHQNCQLMIAGAPCQITVDGQSQADWSAFQINAKAGAASNAGTRIQIRMATTGCRVYLAAVGGLTETETDAMFRLQAQGHRDPPVRTRQSAIVSSDWQPRLGTLRIVRGPEYSDSLGSSFNAAWRVSPHSSGMGIRLTGPELQLPSFDIVSSPVTDGTVQATENGLIALLRQRGTLGGYPRVATVIDCDVDRLAQFRPGDQVVFQWVEPSEARRLLDLQSRELEWL